MIQRILKWLYPGMGVKRWAILIALSALILILGLMGFVGRENVRYLWQFFMNSPIPIVALVGGLILLGLIGISVGMAFLVRSIIREISPGAEGRASELIYSKRLLSRGRKVAAIGGGTGLSTLLRGLKEWTTNLTAIVTVMDDGGSSGVLRRERQILPPGDIRNCLIALAEDESKIAKLFQHRFSKSGSALDSHSLGNLVLAGLQEMTGSFDRAIEEFSTVLKVRGQVLPATLDSVELVAHMADGSLIRGECNIAENGVKQITQMTLSKPRVKPYPKVLSAIRNADVIVLGPGSLYTSIIPNLLVDEIAQEIERSRAIKLYVANLMTQPGETEGFTLGDHLTALAEYIDLNSFNYIVINKEPIPAEYLASYLEDNSVPVKNDLPEESEFRRKIIGVDLLDFVEIGGEKTLKHHSRNLAQAIARCAKDSFAVRPGKN
ncbi:YvcK family protein [Candidatus Acetothermia bacterium]|nr:YvcK family protein [Candidatus Acetothermia bacterium]MBI3643423.1 YvcK family protein [Candidatus Acetothermia bacterium]